MEPEESPNGDTRKESLGGSIRVHFEDLRSRGLDANEAAAVAVRLSCHPSLRLGDVSQVLLNESATEDDKSGIVRQLMEASIQGLGLFGPAFLQVTDTGGAEVGSKQQVPAIDLSSLRSFYSFLKLPSQSDLAITVIKSMESTLEAIKQLNKDKGWEAMGLTKICALVVTLQHPLLMEMEHYGTLRLLLEVITGLPSQPQKEFTAMMARLGSSEMEFAVLMLQQFVIISMFEANQISADVMRAVKLLALLYEANESSHLVAHSAFYNDIVNGGAINIKEDYMRWKHPERFDFCFLKYPFLLDAATKSQVLRLNSSTEMTREFEDALLRNIFGGNLLGIGMGIVLPFNIVRVRRDHLVEDAIAHIQRNPDDLKKPLKVHFEGEEGVDEGGVQKEFFQLIVRDLFDPKYGMFIHREETPLFWFSSTWLDMAREYELVGTVIGLAIYNGHLFEAKFPTVVYKKLLGKSPEFEDLKDVDPELHRGLQTLLDFDGNVEDVFMRSFQLQVEDLYGQRVDVDLKKGGANIPVTNENRQEFVDLCVKYYLTDSIQLQFEAFAKGFHNLCGGPLLRIFAPEELELAICGSQELNFEELESGARYEDGYTKDSKTVKEFWQIVHKELTEEQRKQLLAFVTGSDRAPIRGLRELPFVVSRNGPDSNRLPTAHTCFNHLLLPDYSSAEKLKDFLIKAINNSMGFGLM